MARPKKTKSAKMAEPDISVVDITVAEDAPVEETTEDAPLEDTPVESTEDTPVETTEDAPVEEVHAETTEDAPLEDTPVESTEDTPVESTEDTPAETTEDTPAETTKDAPVEETPAEVPEDAPVEDTPVESTEDTPVEEVPAEISEDAPVEDTPVETTEDAPVEEVPAEVAPEDASADVVSDVPTDEIPVATDVAPANIQFEIVVTEPAYPNIVFVVPYRDRQKQYEFFSTHMKMVLEDYPQGSYKILYVHQQDAREFNRGAMKNIGFTMVKNMYPNDYTNITLVFNDVDTMPYTKNFLDYATTPGTVKHFYGFKFTLGGIVSINAGDFERVNGFPNFWAWGYEDNMLQDRVTKAGITIDRSQFYPILDKNILHFPEGITRNINRTEYDAYKADTAEGIDTITDIKTLYDEDTGFVHVQSFNTNRTGNPQQTFAYDMRMGNEPFKPKTRRGGGMRMFM